METVGIAKVAISKSSRSANAPVMLELRDIFATISFQSGLPRNQEDAPASLIQMLVSTRGNTGGVDYYPVKTSR
jgi:hypothetical protein